MKSVSFVIPAHNEQENLPVLIPKIFEVCEKQQWNPQIIIVDDGSTDSTFSACLTLKEKYSNLKVVRLRIKSGKSIALSVGFARAANDYLVMMDADLQDDPEEVPKLIQKLGEGFDIISGWKIQRNDPWHKVLPSRIFNWFVSVVSGVRLHDINCGLKVMRRQVIQEVVVYGELYRFLMILAHARGFKVAEVPTIHHSRKFGKSKFGTARMFKGFYDILTVFFLIRYRKRPLHFFAAVGSAIGVIGLGILVYLAILHFTGVKIGDRPILIFGTLFCITGLQLILTGLIAELFTFEQPQHQPPIDREL